MIFDQPNEAVGSAMIVPTGSGLDVCEFPGGLMTAIRGTNVRASQYYHLGLAKACD